MPCIWYLLLCTASFSFLESRDTFTVLSFFTVITTGLMKSSSEHLSNFVICFSSMIFFCSSCSTLYNKWSGTLCSLCWDGVYWDLNIHFAIGNWERPSLVHKCGYLWNIYFYVFLRMDFRKWIIFLPGFLFALRVMPSFVSMSLPMMLFVWFSTIKTLRVFVFQDFDFMSSVSIPFISMLLFVNLL